MQFQLTIPTRATATNNCRVRWLTAVTSGSTLGRLALWTYRVTTTLRTTFTTTMRMVDWIHCRTANIGTNPLPAISTRFSNYDVHVIRIASRADRGSASRGNTANFAAWQHDLRPIGIAGHQYCTHPSTAAQHATPTR